MEGLEEAEASQVKICTARIKPKLLYSTCPPQIEAPMNPAIGDPSNFRPQVDVRLPSGLQ
jgi:hypothetical protein